MNLFKKIWYKNLKKGESPSKLASDIGPLSGEFRYLKYNKQGQLLDDKTLTNTIVNQSKTSVIRLISQSTTPWVDASDPSGYKISKMRFSNDQSTSTPNFLIPAWRHQEYYDISEASNRQAEVQLVDLDTSTDITGVYGAGGDLLANTCGSSASLSFQKINTQYASDGWEDVDGKKVFNIVTSNNPPSHNTLKIEFLKNNVTIETIYFHEYDDASTIYPYSRKGRQVVQIINQDLTSDSTYLEDGDTLSYVDAATGDGGSGGLYRFVTTPSKDAGDRDVDEITKESVYTISPSSDTSLTKLIFDYTLSSLTWKFYLEESSFVTAWEAANTGHDYWDTMNVTYEQGAFNVINTIVPASGINAGTGTNMGVRYGEGNIDYYSTLSPTFADAATDFIDDYAVTFRVDMDYTSGNGNIENASVSADAHRKIQYRKAYLFTENDQMFSNIIFDPFEKDEESNFVIYWTIKAPID